MKKTLALLLLIIMMISCFPYAGAAGYSLPEKMLRQLQVGSGLKGSFIVRCNADAERYPLLNAIENAQFEVRGIRSGEDLHYYIYQADHNETLHSLTEFLRMDGVDYFRSDLLGNTVVRLPGIDQLINSYFHAEGENPYVLSDLIHMIYNEETSEENALVTDAFEKQIELFLSAFSTETSLQKPDNESPRLTQTFRIPAESLYQIINSIILTVSENDSVMSYLRTILTEEQMNIYLNPDLGYYYIEALKNMNLEEDIVFTRTMSTLGDLIGNSLFLPLNEEKTGFSSVILESDNEYKSFLFSGSQKNYFLRIPVQFDLKKESFEESVIYLAYTDSSRELGPNVSLRINISEKYEKYDNEEETGTNEIERYTIQAEKNTDHLPDAIPEETIPELNPIDAEVELRYFSKYQPASPTTLDISCKIQQGDYDFSLTCNAKTASQWPFAPFDISNPVNGEKYTEKDLKELIESWAHSAAEKLIRAPEEISLTQQE